jgi:glycerol uptake facilitator-like aquaporin
LDQIVGTALLLFCVRAIGDEKNMKIPGHLAPFAVGFVVLNIGICFGYNCGYAINPARDFGPRVFTSLIGYGSNVYRYTNYICTLRIVRNLEPCFFPPFFV